MKSLEEQKLRKSLWLYFLERPLQHTLDDLQSNCNFLVKFPAQVAQFTGGSSMDCCDVMNFKATNLKILNSKQNFLLLDLLCCSFSCFMPQRIQDSLHATLTTDDSSLIFGVGLFSLHIDRPSSKLLSALEEGGVLAFLLLSSNICWLLRTSCAVKEVQLKRYIEILSNMLLRGNKVL